MNALSFLIAVAPLLLLLAALLSDRYPGERVIGALREIFDPRAGRSVKVEPGLINLCDRRRPPRGGTLIADSLAGRAPPLPV